MELVDNIIDCLERTPVILSGMVKQIPPELYKEKRVPGKWNILDYVHHLNTAQLILDKRFKKFELEKNPYIKSYTPPSKDLNSKNTMPEELAKFSKSRSATLKMLRSFNPSYWTLQGKHEIYTPYSTQILLLHTLNVDYSHMFSIEQLGFTR